MPSPLKLELFGGPILRAGGSEVHLSPLQWALVGYLYGVEARYVSRTELLALLWAEGSESALRRRLSQATYSLQGKVKERLLLCSASSVRSNRNSVACDLDAFRNALGSEEFDVAAAILHKGFLQGLPVVPTGEYERWLDRRAASFRSELRLAATKRWSRAEHEGLWTQKTLEAARALLRLSPGDQAALRRTMWAQAMVSTPLEAIATVESFSEINRLRIPAELDEETRTLLERVRALSKRPRSRGVEGRQGSRVDPTLYGRDAELGRLRPQLSGVVKDGLTVLQVVGAAGLGKSRLVAECLDPSVLQGRLVLRAQLAELERDIPLNALIESFSTQEVARALAPLAEPWRSLLLSLMPKFIEVVGPAKPIPAVQPASLQRRLLEAVRLLVERVVEDQPLVLFLDDFHWVDDSSLAALEYLRRRWSSGSGVLVVTVRPEFVGSDSKLQGFLDGEDVVRIELDELDDVSQVQLVREVAGGEIDKEVLATLQALGGGNPLYLIELTRQWQEGRLVLPERRSDQIQLPVSIQQLYEHRFRGLKPLASRMLEALAVWGKRIRIGDAAALAAVTVHDATAGIEDLDQMGLLRWDGEGVTLSHGLVRQAVLSRTNEARKLLLHRLAAEYLVSLPDPDLDELALHRDRAGQRDDAFELSLEVANQAERVGAVSEAVRFLKIAVRNASPSSRPEVLGRLSDLLYKQCRYEEAGWLYQELVDTAAGVASGIDLCRARIRVLDCQARQIATSFDRFVTQNRALRMDAAALGSDELVAIALRSALHQLQRVNRIDALDDLLQDIDRCASSTDPRARCLGLRLRAVVLLLQGRGAEQARQASAVAEENGLVDLLPSVAIVELTASLVAGKLATAEGRRIQESAIAVSQRVGDLLCQLQILNNIGAFYLDVEEPEIARQYLSRARRVAGESLSIPEDLHLLMNLGELALASGQLGEARAAFQRCCPERVGQQWHGWGVAHAGLGLCALLDGRLREARNHEERMIEGIPDTSPFPIDHGLCAVFRARLAMGLQDTARAMQILIAAERRLNGVHVPQFLRIRAQRVRLMSRGHQPGLSEAASEGLRMTEELELKHLARFFSRHCARA